MKKAKFQRWFCGHSKESKLNLASRLRVFENGRMERDLWESGENAEKRRLKGETEHSVLAILNLRWRPGTPKGMPARHALISPNEGNVFGKGREVWNEAVSEILQIKMIMESVGGMKPGGNQEERNKNYWKCRKCDLWGNDERIRIFSSKKKKSKYDYCLRKHYR